MRKRPLSIRGKVRRILANIGEQFLPRAEVAGFQVVVWTRRGELETYLPRVREALELILIHDPRRVGRLRRNIRGFAIEEAGGDHFDQDLRLHVLDARWLLQSSSIALASRIVHEGVHARLYHCGIAWDPIQGARTERICVNEQIAFLQKVPGSATVVEGLMRVLATEWWGEAQARKRWRERMLARGVPEWLLRLRGGA